MKLRKYPNRRLYDLDQSRYTTFARVEAAIRGGDELVVECQGVDITRRVLLDIWRRQQINEGIDGLSTQRLHEMIRGVP